MPVLVSAVSLSMSYGPRPLFSDLSFDLDSSDRVGLIGPNGAGKSTLLKILAGLETPDHGERTLRRGSRIAYVPQDDEFPAGLSTHAVIVHALKDLALEDYERDTHAAIALTAAGFESEQDASTLSGGWRKRLSVARAMAQEPDFLLMDEPTNHLDLPGIVWLEQLLKSSSFGYLVATHDRCFLRGIAADVMEISRVYPAGVFRSAGGFDVFADRKAEFLDAQERKRDAVANQVRRESDWLGRKESAQRKKSRSRIEEAADRRAELADLNARTGSSGTATIDFASSGRQTRKLIDAAGISKTLGDRTLFRNVDLVLSPGRKLGILGVNGSGKSTLLKILSGEMAPDRGTITRADNLKVEVFEQGRSSLDLTATLARALSPNSDEVTFNGRSMHVAAWAARFLFRAEMLDVQMSALSGGERARVRIAQLMLRPADVLLLDEPTNDLDLATLEVLEESLSEFPGAVVLISHDREMMDRLGTEHLGLDGRGNAGMYGSVEQWLAALPKEESPVSPPPPVKATAVKKSKGLTFKEQQEYERIEETIHAAEAAVNTARNAVESSATAGHAALAKACGELEAAERELERLFARWEDLAARS